MRNFHRTTSWTHQAMYTTGVVKIYHVVKEVNMSPVVLIQHCFLIIMSFYCASR